MQDKLFVISGSSGVGKGTLISKFIEANDNLKLSISVTTRKPRPGEVDGVNYFYVSEEDFKESIENNEFLEWAVFSEHFYGTKESFVKKSLAKGMSLILEIETQGAFQVREKIKDAVLIFILPPSFEELEKRLRGRHTETEEAIQMRLQMVRDEIEASKEFDYHVVNDNIDVALAKLQEIFDKERGN